MSEENPPTTDPATDPTTDPPVDEQAAADAQPEAAADAPIPDEDMDALLAEMSEPEAGAEADAAEPEAAEPEPAAPEPEPAAPEPEPAAPEAVAEPAADADDVSAMLNEDAINALLQEASFEDSDSPSAGANAAGAEPMGLPDIQKVDADADAGSIDLLRDVDLNVKIELGRSRMSVEDVLKLIEGSVVELDKLAGDPVDVFINERLVARGEVLVLNDNFCVRVNEIVQAAATEA
ncbi:MAG: flagellar motor switch protein FliN, partial [Planctomycetota bacterium]